MVTGSCYKFKLRAGNLGNIIGASWFIETPLMDMLFQIDTFWLVIPTGISD